MSKTKNPVNDELAVMKRFASTLMSMEQGARDRVMAYLTQLPRGTVHPTTQKDLFE